MTIRFNTMIPEVKDTSSHFICYLTKELPCDPVVAEDGHVYERTAIESYIAAQQKYGVLKSPTTKEPMGESLVTAVQHKKLIEALVKENDVLEPELVSKWNEKVKEKKAKEDLEDLLNRAKNGDVEAIYRVGMNYFNGDAELAYAWLEKSHDAGNAKAAAVLGYLCYNGLGVEESPTQALYYWTMAASEGSRLASFWLGEMFAHGCPGVAVNKNKAIRWARIAVKENPRGDDFGLWKLNKVKAQELLDGLTTGVAN